MINPNEHRVPLLHVEYIHAHVYASKLQFNFQVEDLHVYHAHVVTQCRQVPDITHVKTSNPVLNLNQLMKQ